MKHETGTYSKEIYDENHPEEMQELLDFANMVFSMSYGGTDFASLLPKAYARSRWHVPAHHMIRENGRIRALIDTYPLVMKLGGETPAARKLKAAYVGTVCVHPASRGKGYMIELMKRAEEDALQQGSALMLLDGDRHRYQYFGFERAGVGYRFQMEQNNIRHCCAQTYSAAYMASSVYSFEELDEHSPYLDFLYGLYQRRVVTARSREAFWLCLQSYHAAVYVILRGSEPAGYVNLSEDEKTILEIEMDEPGELPRVVYDLMIGFELPQLCAKIGMDETAYIRQFEKMCDNCSAAMSHQIKILDYKAVLEFLLSWKQKYHTLAEQECVIGIIKGEEQIPEKYLVSVTKECICVSRTERAADVVLGALALIRTLTTGLGIAFEQSIPVDWLPLPCYLPDADTF